jgi:hypothetical protein
MEGLLCTPHTHTNAQAKTHDQTPWPWILVEFCIWSTVFFLRKDLVWWLTVVSPFCPNSRFYSQVHGITSWNFSNKKLVTTTPSSTPSSCNQWSSLTPNVNFSRKQIMVIPRESFKAQPCTIIKSGIFQCWYSLQAYYIRINTSIKDPPRLVWPEAIYRCHTIPNPVLDPIPLLRPGWYVEKLIPNQHW